MSLHAPMVADELRIEPAREAHREALRAACAEDREVWQIYPYSFVDEHFDARFDQFFESSADCPFVLFDGEAVVGMTSFLRVDEGNGTLEIGRTYIVPQLRGTGYNARVKELMLDRAFACGFRRVEFRVDTRNSRSMAAVEKLGAMREGTLRRDRMTWTGYLRDTALYAILADEWWKPRA